MNKGMPDFAVAGKVDTLDCCAITSRGQRTGVGVVELPTRLQ